MATENKCISVSREFAVLAEENHLSWSKAAIIGMAIMLGDAGVREYDNQLNLYRKMSLFKSKAEGALQKLEELEKKNGLQSQ